jgi:thioredoxin 1
MTVFEAGGGSIITYILSGALVGYLLYSFIKARKRMNRPASPNVKVLDEKNFDSTVKSGVSLIDFWAVWCGPCKVQGPIVDEVADEIGGKANICKLDVDQNQRIAQKFGIRNIPTILILKDGKPVEKFVGVKPKNTLIKAVNSHL